MRRCFLAVAAVTSGVTDALLLRLFEDSRVLRNLHDLQGWVFTHVRTVELFHPLAWKRFASVVAESNPVPVFIHDALKSVHIAEAYVEHNLFHVWKRYPLSLGVGPRRQCGITLRWREARRTDRTAVVGPFA